MSNNFNFKKTLIEDLYIIQRNPINDKRGSFERLFCINDFSNFGLKESILQINLSTTTQTGTIRGMHFQHPPMSEIKIISCLEGEVLDILVDIRENSPTFLNFHSEILNSTNNKSVLVPKGFAHGFQTLTDNCKLIYLHSQFYNKEYEGNIHPLDPALSIKWPKEITEISEKDNNKSFINSKFSGI